MRIYLAGPMRGIPDFNFPAFNKEAAWLREQGHEVFNPAENGDQTNVRECFRLDTDWICRYADGIALLPGWEASKGAKAELALAEALGLEVIYLD